MLDKGLPLPSLTPTEFTDVKTLLTHSLSHLLETTHHGTLEEGQIRTEY